MRELVNGHFPGVILFGPGINMPMIKSRDLICDVRDFCQKELGAFALRSIKTIRVLLSDFTLWHFPFSYQRFIGQNEEESMVFEKMLEDKGLDKTKLKRLPKDIQEEIIKSWDKTFDMDFNDPYHTCSKETKSIQATFWTLSIDEIVKVDGFVAR